MGADGEVVNKARSWEAGADGAKPRIVLWAEPALDEPTYQELCAGEAEDQAEVIDLAGQVSITFGDYEDLLVRYLRSTCGGYASFRSRGTSTATSPLRGAIRATIATTPTKRPRQHRGQCGCAQPAPSGAVEGRYVVGDGDCQYAHERLSVVVSARRMGVPGPSGGHNTPSF